MQRSIRRVQYNAAQHSSLHRAQNQPLTAELIEHFTTFFDRHEDSQAFHGGSDGLEVIKEILQVSPKILKPDR